jgi:hypothetical protein
MRQERSISRRPGLGLDRRRWRTDLPRLQIRHPLALRRGRAVPSGRPVFTRRCTARAAETAAIGCHRGQPIGKPLAEGNPEGNPPNELPV